MDSNRINQLNQQNKKNSNKTYCPKCNRHYYLNSYCYNCPKCGCRLIEKIPNNTYTPKCPVCGSPNISKLSTLKRGAYGAAFGLFSKTARSQWECLNCGNKF